MAYPIASMSDGTILYSDGTRQAPASFNPVSNLNGTTYISNANPTANPNPQNNSGSSNTGSITSTPDYSSTYQSVLSGLEGDVNKYVDELKNVAQGDYDFAAKWIEANYKEALGNNDQKRADFLKKVANSLEDQVGRIQYDYNTQSFRLTQNKDIALQRLQEDQKVLTENLTTERNRARDQQDTNLNARGLMESGTRDTVQGIANKPIGQLEQDYQRQFEALARAGGRSTQDITNTFNQGMEDVTTQARRAAQDSTQAQQYQTEAAKRALERAQKNADITGYGLKLQLPGLAEQKTLQQLGLA